MKVLNIYDSTCYYNVLVDKFVLLTSDNLMIYLDFLKLYSCTPTVKSAAHSPLAALSVALCVDISYLKVYKT